MSNNLAKRQIIIQPLEKLGIAMKNRLLFTVIVGVAIAFFDLPQVLAQSRQTVQNFPNGQYAYKWSRPANTYIAFQKTGRKIVGAVYERYTDNLVCLSGTLNGNIITNVTNASSNFTHNSVKYSFSQGKPINLSSLSRIQFNQVNSNKKVLQICNTIFRNRR